MSDFSSSLLGLATARQTSRLSAPHSSWPLIQGWRCRHVARCVDLLPDRMVDLVFDPINSGRTAQYKHNVQFLRHFGLHGDVNDAHRDGANRLKNKNNIPLDDVCDRFLASEDSSLSCGAPGICSLLISMASLRVMRTMWALILAVRCW